MLIEQISATFLIILISGIAAIITARFSRLPLTLCVLLWGMVSSALIPLSGFDTGIRADNFESLILYILIPILVFEAALSLEMPVLKPVFGTIAFMSTLGVLLATSIAAAILYYAIGYPQAFPWLAALLTGLVISATDPVAVVAQLKQAGTSKKLATLIEGESLFNDATALVLFGIILAMLTGDAQPTFLSGVVELVKVLVGGVAVGWGLARVAKGLVPLARVHHCSSIVVSLALAYGSFYIAEHLLHVSGVIAVLTAAISAKSCLYHDETDRAFMHHSWESFAFMANLVVFYLMGLVVTWDMFTEQWLAMLFGIVAAFVSRAVVTALSVGVGKYVFREALEWRYAPVMTWGGLRGVITLALVLSLPVELETWWTIQSIGFGVVLFTLLVQATTNPLLISWLKLGKPATPDT